MGLLGADVGGRVGVGVGVGVEWQGGLGAEEQGRSGSGTAACLGWTQASPRVGNVQTAPLLPRTSTACCWGSA
jgi:hypothetical protein